MKKWICILALGMAGCGGPPADARLVVLAVSGPEGSPKVRGTVRASSPGQAGVGLQNFDIVVPGRMEFKGGTSEYTVQLDTLPREDKLTITVDGRELVRGSEVIWEDDKGPRLTFTINTNKK